MGMLEFRFAEPAADSDCEENEDSLFDAKDIYNLMQHGNHDIISNLSLQRLTVAQVCFGLHRNHHKDILKK